jgi:hypothetical protein
MTISPSWGTPSSICSSCSIELDQPPFVALDEATNVMPIAQLAPASANKKLRGYVTAKRTDL